MKVHFIFQFKDGPWGGGNQFLRALKKEFTQRNMYAESVEEADVVLFNSHHCLKDVRHARLKHPEKIFVHRLDGIMSLTRKDKRLDRNIYRFNRRTADGTIFQSQWAKRMAEDTGYTSPIPDAVIMNAPDPGLFYASPVFSLKTPVRLMANSWSANENKGFKYLKWIDENLDFTRYQMTFVGNTSVSFKNIKYIPPQPPGAIASLLKEHDIFLFAGKNEACSNSVIEALHSGVPVVSLDSGSNNEIVAGAGVSFSCREDLIPAIEKVVVNYKNYRDKIDMPGIKEISENYYEFFSKVRRMKTTGKFERRIKYNGYLKCKIYTLWDKMKMRG